MGFWDNGPKDTSTPEQRKGWRDRADEQIKEQRGEQKGAPATPAPAPGSQHRRARRPE